MFEGVFCFASPCQQSQNYPAVQGGISVGHFGKFPFLSSVAFLLWWRAPPLVRAGAVVCRFPSVTVSKIPAIRVRLPHQLLLKLSGVCQFRFASLPRRDVFLNRRNVPEDTGAHAQRQPVIFAERISRISLCLSVSPCLSVSVYLCLSVSLCLSLCLFASGKMQRQWAVW